MAPGPQQDDLLHGVQATTLLDAAPDAYVIVDAAGIIRAVNRCAPELFGLSEAELLGAPVEDLLPQAMREAHVKTRTTYIQTPQARPMGVGLPLRAERSDGSVFPVDISLSPIQIGGQKYVIAAIRNVSENTAVREDLQRVQQEAAIAEERERLARDLHDTVIQEVFAVGLSLQSISGRVDDATAGSRIGQAIDDLDRVIRDIRTAIFGLVSHKDWGRGVRGEVLRVAANQGRALGFEPVVSFTGPIDDLQADLAEQLLPTLREALSNVAKHAKARRCDVSIVVDGEHLELRVVDDGVGPSRDPQTGGQGLTNLASRAASLGGSCELGPASISGSLLEWRVPLTQP